MSPLGKIRSNCTLRGKHWLWRGALSHKCPAMHHEGRTVAVRRVILEIRDGEPLPVGAKALTSCEHHHCVSPHCAVSGTQSDVCSRIAERMSDTAKHVLAGRRAATARRRATLSAADVERLRTSSERMVDMAAALGITEAHGYKVRNHKRWRDFTAPHFLGLGAAQ